MVGRIIFVILLTKRIQQVRKMKRTIIMMLMLAGMTATAMAQTFKGNFRNEELKITVVLDLYNDSVPVPGMEDELCYGYLRGNLNGMWVILKVLKLEEGKALVRAACDNGSDVQNLEIQPVDDKLQIKQVDDAFIKGIEGKKYVKLPKPFFVHK